jgi:hypothetical protein
MGPAVNIQKHTECRHAHARVYARCTRRHAQTRPHTHTQSAENVAINQDTHAHVFVHVDLAAPGGVGAHVHEGRAVPRPLALLEGASRPGVLGDLLTEIAEIADAVAARCRPARPLEELATLAGPVRGALLPHTRWCLH